uniref:subtilisin-like protease SBT1.3 n=1 Tax=Erigeron canadensis TaxID=72917 RepID=UPI001CB8D063|nr:subtilisin-like protease SBT1.3 [Erigeron canadensis]
MERIQVQWCLFLYLFLFINCVMSTSNTNVGFKKTFIVHMNNIAMPPTFTDHVEWYASVIQSLTVSPLDNDNEDDKRIIYTYRYAFHGIAARLTDEEAERLEGQHGVISVLPDTKYELQTTRSPMFLGLEPQDKTTIGFDDDLTGNDVVVGVVDTGIWPESESFIDTHLTSVPSHWKGACEVGPGFEKRHCDKKIVGARSFYRGNEAANGGIDEEEEYKSPRDQDGHGTHTASTVAGSPVHGANLFGYAYGTARGMSPGARIAAYKVCWLAGCFSSDILSAVDQAVKDGVNVLSISLGGGASSYSRDILSIATFGAMEKGVFVSCAAGNEGPEAGSITNVSPWMTTVGASIMDRDFPGVVRLGNGKILSGVSIFSRGETNMSLEKQYYPLVFLGTNSSSSNPASLCMVGTLDNELVSGKIVICDRGVNPRAQKGQVVKDAGGIGMILLNNADDGGDLVADSHVIPTVALRDQEGKAIKEYALKERKPMANLKFFRTKVGIRPSPVVASFSSRGPNGISPSILKPDVVAPGVNILAAWTGVLGPTGLYTDRRRVKFNLLSGTSMSCPHVSGVAAWLMARRPGWSPAAIKSALMTTAYVHDHSFDPLSDSSTGGPSGPFEHGSGHINPPKALDPGLVYDIGPQDYFDFLCTQGLTKTELKVFAKFSNRTCQHSISKPGDLNYPALSVAFPKDERVRKVTLKRTVTNVGLANSKYHVAVSRFKGVNVKVKPATLNFVEKYEKLSYKVTFILKAKQTTLEYGGLIWNDGVHRVRSPIVITWL